MNQAGSEAIDRLLDDDLLVDEAATLMRHIESDRDALELLAQRALLSVGLRQSLKRRRMQALALADIDHFGPSEVPKLDSVAGSPPAPQPTLGFLGTALQFSATWLASPRVLAAGITVCLFTYFLVLVVSLAITRAHLGNRNPKDLSRPAAETSARLTGGTGASRIVEQRPAPPSAILTRADNARWQEKSSTTARDYLAGQTLQVRTGQAELTFAHGAMVVVQGPADFEVCSPNSGFLHRGKLVATVPSRAIGFTIKTPMAEIVDLGTEFGVEVDDQQNAEVHVFTGVVVARESASSATHNKEVRVTAGNALRVDSQQAKFTSIPINPEWRSEFAKGPTNRRVVTLQSATADYSQDGYSINKTIDGDLSGGNGWAIGLGGAGVDHTAVWESTTDPGGTVGTNFTFTMPMLFGVNHTIRRFRLSVTTDAHSNFADGVATAGDITANWTTLAPLTVTDTEGATFTINGDNSVTVSGRNPESDTYTVIATTALTGITGFRLETFAGVGAAAEAGVGPGRSESGNFVLNELQVQAEPLTAPQSIGD